MQAASNRRKRIGCLTLVYFVQKEIFLSYTVQILLFSVNPIALGTAKLLRVLAFLSAIGLRNLFVLQGSFQSEMGKLISK